MASMNTSLMKRTAVRIAESKTFNQGVWANACGTPGCIAGHVCVEMGCELVRRHTGNDYRYVAKLPDARAMAQVEQHWGYPDTWNGPMECDIAYAAAGFLGIRSPISTQLFASYSDMTARNAVAVLTHLADTGEVEWNLDIDGDRIYSYGILDREGRMIGCWKSVGSYERAKLEANTYEYGGVIRLLNNDGYSYTCGDEGHRQPRTWYVSVERAVEAVTEDIPN